MPGKALPDNFEEDLAKYCQKASQIFYGVTYYDLRQLAYQLGIANNVSMPQCWVLYEIAGKNRLKSFNYRRLKCKYGNVTTRSLYCDNSTRHGVSGQK